MVAPYGDPDYYAHAHSDPNTSSYAHPDSDANPFTGFQSVQPGPSSYQYRLE